MNTGQPVEQDLPIVSVIIPIYNEVKYIEDCLRSVLEQQYPSSKLEVLVLDGGSKDGTQDKVRKIAHENICVRLIDNPGRTQVKAFNLGVRESKGEVIIRMDAHAHYNEDYILRCVETLEKTQAANVGGVCLTEPTGTGLIARTISRVYQMRFGIGGARFRVGGKAGPTDTVPFGAFKKSTFDKVGLMNDILARGEDNEFNSRIRTNGLMVYFNPEIVSTYYSRPTIRAFLKQMYDNGLYHMLTLRVNRAGCSVRHFIPFFFVMSLIICGLGAFLWPVVGWLGLGIFLAYFMANLLASIAESREYGWEYLLILPWLIFLVHMTYGIGTLMGILRFGFISLEKELN